MALVNAKCTNCGKEILIDENKDADICLHCNTAFVTEKAIKLFNAESEKEKQARAKKRRHIFRSLGSALLLVLKCIGYLFYVLLCLWLFFDIVDDIKKK